MIKAAKNDDCNTLAELAIQMWDNSTTEELTEDFSKIISSDTSVCYIKYIDTVPVGFAQCGLRNDYVEGTDSSPVGYLEGIFVKEEHRNKGYAKELLAACEKWAKTMGCTEFASDCELSNINSLNFHISMGFCEANRIICLTKHI
ncbi:MAG: GNAT family N-acetyltransferase [Oscillospiraceae bacterium]|nr:GNAT family N-acetyltransferase [Oscillospiraceae bacterium]